MGQILGINCYSLTEVTGSTPMYICCWFGLLLILWDYP